MNSFKKILFTILLTSYNIVHAQVQIGDNNYSKNPGKINKEILNQFKQSTTYFVLQERDYPNIDAFKTAISKVWTITPFEIITPDKIAGLNKSKSSFFDFGGFIIVRQGSAATTHHTHLSYNLFTLETNQKGKTKQHLLAKFMLHLDGEAYLETMRWATNQKVFNEKITPYMYRDAVMGNWNPLMISGYLKIINDGLMKEEMKSVFDETTNKEALKKLQTETLYIPNYVNLKFNMFTGAEKDTEEDNESNKSYPFPHEYIDAQELSKKAASAPNGLYYLVYTKSSTDKFVSIFNSQSGELLYSEYTPVSYNFKGKDLKRLSSKIK